MTRENLTRARQLLRLRDLALDAAMRRLCEATAALAEAVASEIAAARVRDDGVAALAATRAALVEDPGDAPLGLARIARAEARLTAAEAVLAAAVEAREAADIEVLDARTAARRAQARRDAMAERADRLRRGLALAFEERAAVEAEDGFAAMRRAA